MTIRRNLALLTLAALQLPTVAPLSAAEPAKAEPLLGFHADGSDAQRALEAQFDAGIEPKDLKAWLERLAARPHHVASGWGNAHAPLLLDPFASLGF